MGAVLTAVLQVGGFLFFPAAAILAARHNRILGWLSPVVLCYVAGILTGNFPGVTLNAAITRTAMQASVLLAIPLLLFPTDFRRWLELARPTVLSFLAAVVAIMLSSAFGAWYFADARDDHWQLAGMLVGVYTGGTPNMTAIAMALDVPESTFILVNAADLLLSSVYLLLLMTVLPRLLRRWLPAFQPVGAAVEHTRDETDSQFSRKWRQGVVALGASVAVGGVTVAAVRWWTGTLAGPAVILGITSLGIAGSFWPALRRQAAGYDAGQYLLLCFCIAIGTMAELTELAAALSSVFGYVSVVFVGAIALHLAFARLLRIDADTVVITSTAAVFGPPFVGAVGQVLGNREVVVGGLTAGVIGYALGNYLGLGVAWWLQF